MSEQTWHSGRPTRLKPSIVAWIDGGWLSVREDSDLLQGPLGDEPSAHVVQLAAKILAAADEAEVKS